MSHRLDTKNEEIYQRFSFDISEVLVETESKEYTAYQFNLNGLKIVMRTAKITPKKNGQFVTFWRRNKMGVTEPFRKKDLIDFYVVNVAKGNRRGQFVIPHHVLIENKIISSGKVGGKRGFRVYPNWDMPISRQAIKTKEWQSKYFIEVNKDTDLIKLKSLYQKH